MAVVERFEDLNDVTAALIERGRLSQDESLMPLDGGVSSLVGLTRIQAPPVVVKVARHRLAVAEEWLVDQSRTLREAAVLALLDGVLGPVRVPRLLFVEPDLNLIGIEAILPIRSTWKEDLLQGVVEPAVANALGEAMASLHTLGSTQVLASQQGKDLFEALRIEPYYVQVGRVVPDLADTMSGLAAELRNPARPTLVQGDVTPKNVIPIGPPYVLLDFEVIHSGEPAFDPSMLFAHLVLKSIYGLKPLRAREITGLITVAWSSYQAQGGPALEGTVARHLGGIILARLFGKSRIHYLETERERRVAERVGRALLKSSIPLDEVTALVQEVI